MGLKFWILVALGGALGAGLRTGVAVALPWSPASGWPAATLLVNLCGCFAIGVCWTLLADSSPELRALAIAGALGALTTFSTFGLDAVRLLEQGRLLTAAGYVIGSTLAGLLLVYAGLKAGSVLVP